MGEREGWGEQGCRGGLGSRPHHFLQGFAGQGKAFGFLKQLQWETTAVFVCWFICFYLKQLAMNGESVGTRDSAQRPILRQERRAWTRPRGLALRMMPRGGI